MQRELEQALVFLRQGNLAQAERLYRAVLARAPSHFDALFNLGAIAAKTKNPRGAADFFGRAIEARPDNAAAHGQRAVALLDLGEHAQALADFDRALALQPDDAQLLNNRGNTLYSLRRHQEAIESYDRALSARPDFPVALANRGAALLALGRLAEALASLERAIQLKCAGPQVHCNRGNVLRGLERPAAALESFQRALAVDRAHPETLFSYGITLCEVGRLEEGMAALSACIALRPRHAAAHDALIFALLRTSTDGAAVLEQCRRFGANFEHGVQWPSHANLPDAGRRLKVGYVSGDFRDHSVARFAEPILANHDREAFEVFCYSNHRVVDGMTRHLMRHADHWRAIDALTDERASALIREDGIDILVDLSGHTSHNRLPLFARKPAPVQVTTIGVPCTTGLAAVDYRLTNAYTDPVGLTEPHHTETLVRLPMSACCLPEPNLPPVGELPALSKGYVTFASFNHFNKLTPAVCALWARILAALPGSRLTILCDAASRDDARRTFGAHGIGGERLLLADKRPLRDYLASHGEADIALDPFPYNGGTITRNCLWMGVPVVSLAGATSVSRFGYALLSQVGLESFVAHDADEYLRIALHWARDLEGLGEVRRTLRRRMQDAPFNDAIAYTRAVEAAYRGMWQAWCAGRAPTER